MMLAFTVADLPSALKPPVYSVIAVLPSSIHAAW